jgi:hypothetical protein
MPKVFSFELDVKAGEPGLIIISVVSAPLRSALADVGGVRLGSVVDAVRALGSVWN